MIRIEFVNGSVIEYEENTDVVRGKMSNYVWSIEKDENEKNEDSE
jgi:hypothetical protein